MLPTICVSICAQLRWGLFFMWTVYMEYCRWRLHIWQLPLYGPSSWCARARVFQWFHVMAITPQDMCDHTEYCTHDAADLHALIGSMGIPRDENEVYVAISISLCSIRLRCGELLFSSYAIGWITYTGYEVGSTTMQQDKHVWCLMVVWRYLLESRHLPQNRIYPASNNTTLRWASRYCSAVSYS